MTWRELIEQILIVQKINLDSKIKIVYNGDREMVEYKFCSIEDQKGGVYILADKPTTHEQ